MRLLLGILALTFASHASAQFGFTPPGTLESPNGGPLRPGVGHTGSEVFAPGIRFPMESGEAYANSQVYGHGGGVGSGGGQCDAGNFSYPWHDNFCEERGRSMFFCTMVQGHQGQDIRATDCRNNVHWVVAASDGMVTNVGSYSVYVTASDGTRFDYLHMRSVAVAVGQRVSRGDRLGRVSNAYGGTATTFHLHFNIRQNVAGHGTAFVPTYMSLVRAYEETQGPPAYRAVFVRQSFPLASQPFELSPGEVVAGSMEFRNEGSETWMPGEVRIGTTQPRDAASPIAAPDWLSSDRPATVEAATAPGEVGVFRFSVQAPTSPGDYPQYFNLLHEGVIWFSESGGPADDVLQIRVQSVAGRCTDSDWVCEGAMRVRCVDGTFEREMCPDVCMLGSCDVAIDEDGDGFSSDVDCDDADPDIYPGAAEICDDGIDQDCSDVDATCGPVLPSGDAGPGGDGSVLDAGVRMSPTPGGCGCRATSSRPVPLGVLLIGVAVALLRRRR